MKLKCDPTRSLHKIHKVVVEPYKRRIQGKLGLTSLFISVMNHGGVSLERSSITYISSIYV